MKHEVKPEQVPDVVWSAFCEAVYKYGYGPHALAAALNAWPGMTSYVNVEGERVMVLTLAQRQEASDDQ